MRERTGIFLLLILYGVGIVSLMVNDLRNVVLPLSPYTLLLSFLILMNSYRWKSPVVWVAILVFLLGFTAEWVGVQKGWLFGVYHYGSNLGPKLAGVPLIIGINWAMLTLATGAKHGINAQEPLGDRRGCVLTNDRPRLCYGARCCGKRLLVLEGRKNTSLQLCLLVSCSIIGTGNQRWNFQS